MRTTAIAIVISALACVSCRPMPTDSKAIPEEPAAEVQKVQKEDTKIATVKDTITPSDTTAQSETTAKPDTTSQSNSTAATETKDDEADTPESVEPPKVKTTTTGTGEGLTNRAVDTDRMSIVLDNISQDLEAQKLDYISKLGQDCSGIYHKIKDKIQQKMSSLGDLTKYTYPTYDKDRNSRQIAYWYHEHGNLHIVHNALADANKIRPGTVMFYGRTDEKYDNLNIEMLSNPGKFVHDPASSLGKIFHIAIVTKVEKDDAGNLKQYTIMHGRNSRNFASRTGGNYDGPGGYKKAHADFPFGNWNQQWVAMANLETEIN